MRARVTFSKRVSTLGAALTMRFLLLSACLAVTRAENVDTNDDANAADDENVTGFPPVDDLTDGARARRAAFAAAMACALVAL